MFAPKSVARKQPFVFAGRAADLSALFCGCIVLLLLLLLSGSLIHFCLGAPVLASDLAGQKKQIESVLDKQVSAWNKGKLDEFMQGYLQSAETSYTSGGSEVWGYEALSQRYTRKYGDKPETMGKLKFSDLKIVELGQDHALVIGHWHLRRDASADLNGVFSLVFSKTKNGWKIIHDHSSLAEKVEEKKQQ